MPAQKTGLAYFIISSRTAIVIAMTPVRIVGSATREDLLECRRDNGMPLVLYSKLRSYPPDQFLETGALVLVRGQRIHVA